MPALFALITLGAAGYASASTPAPTTDHDSVVVGRRMFTGEAWVIDDILDWAAPLVAAAGFTGVVLGSEVTGRATAWMAVFVAWVDPRSAPPQRDLRRAVLLRRYVHPAL